MRIYKRASDCPPTPTSAPVSQSRGGSLRLAPRSTSPCLRCDQRVALRATRFSSHIVERWRPFRRKLMCAMALLLIIGIIVGGFMLGRAERAWAKN